MAQACYEAVFMTWFANNPFGVNCCKCCDSLCRCGCCWDAGELDPNDFPEQSKAQEEAAKKETDTETPPAYKPNTMVKPSETQVEVPKTQVESTAIPATQ